MNADAAYYAASSEIYSFSAHPYEHTYTTHITRTQRGGEGGGGDVSQEPEHNEATRVLDTIKEHTRITPLAHTNAADVSGGFLPRHIFEEATTPRQLKGEKYFHTPAQPNTTKPNDLGNELRAPYKRSRRQRAAEPS